MDAPDAITESADTAAANASLQLPPEALARLRELASSYVWWKTPEEAIQFPSRIAAQVMNLGTWEDVNQLERAVGDNYLRKVLHDAEAGQFDARSWHYWHYRLGLAECGKTQVPPMPVRKIE